MARSFAAASTTADLDFADGVGGEGRREGAAAGTVEFYVVVGVEAGTELNENGETNCQVQGKTTRVRLKEQSKLKNKTAECGLMKSRA